MLTLLRVTTNYVLAEFVPLAQVRGPPRDKALAFVRRAIDNEETEVVWVDETLHTRAVELLLKRQDKDYSLCDAVSFVLMRERSLSDALTTDKRFEQEGFVRLLQP